MLFRNAVCVVAVAVGAAGQGLVVDRAGPAAGLVRLARPSGAGFVGDAFRLGTSGEFWIIDAIRVWAALDSGAACRAPLGDRLEKAELLGGLYNAPPPGEPDCACHTLIVIASGAFAPGAATTRSPYVRWTPAAGGAWQVDFRNLHWSVPGGNEMLYSVRFTGRESDPCASAANWALQAVPAPPDYRLRLFDTHGLHTGQEPPADPPRQVRLQVRAHKVKP